MFLADAAFWLAIVTWLMVDMAEITAREKREEMLSKTDLRR